MGGEAPSIQRRRHSGARVSARCLPLEWPDTQVSGRARRLRGVEDQRRKLECELGEGDGNRTLGLFYASAVILDKLAFS